MRTHTSKIISNQNTLVAKYETQLEDSSNANSHIENVETKKRSKSTYIIKGAHCDVEIAVEKISTYLARVKQ